MTNLLLRNTSAYDQVVVAFANTGEENEQTLEFVKDCDEWMGFKTVWVEAVVHEAKGIGTTHKLVTYETASRKGQPYEAVIHKFGIPNSKFPHCTRELKERPLASLIRSLGWTDYKIAIGIRADEANRVTTRERMIYPLVDWKIDKPKVLRFWEQQPFRLRLTGYQGNCKWCWKKSDRKLLTIMDETPEVFWFPERMEYRYGTVGPEFAKTVEEGYRRVFFRGNKSVGDLRKLLGKEQSPSALEGDEDPCAETCEVTFAES
jgi:hypothetical protein